MIQKRILIYVSMIILLFFALPAYATEYFVKNSGNDGANGRSDGTAWKTISRVNSASLSSGDVVYFKRGNTWSGTQLRVKSSVTYDAYGTGNLPHISTAGKTGAQSPAVYNSGGTNAKLFRLKLTGGSDLGTYAAVISGNSKYAEIAYCEINSTVHSYSEYVCGVGNAFGNICKNVHHCTINVPYGVGIHGQNCGGCSFRDNKITAGDMPIKVGDGCSSGCSGPNLVEGNYIVMTDKVSGAWGVTFKSVKDSICRNNVIDVSSASISASGAIGLIGGAHGISNIEVYNNTIISRGGNVGLYSYCGSSCKIRNNIFYDFDTGIDANGDTASHNTFWSNNSKCNGANCSNTVNLSNNPFIAQGSKPISYYALNNVSGGGSELKDGGTTQDSDIPDYDYTKTLRNGAQWIGAFEYSGGSPPPGGDIPSAPTNLQITSNYD